MNIRLKPLHRSNPYKRYAYEPNRKIVFCPIPKNGSTTWYKWMCQLGGDGPIEDGAYRAYVDDHMRLRHHGARVARRALFGNDHLRFVIVRNPWERLISAFTNKIVNADNDDVNASTMQLLASPRERRACGTLEQQAECLGQFTFRQFIEAVVRAPERTQNEHWRPQYLYLGRVDFDMIGHFEDMAGFAGRLADRIGIPVELSRLNTTRYAGSADDTVSRDCLADVSIHELREDGTFDKDSFYDSELIDRVAGYYRQDIERFEYRFESMPAHT